MYLYCSASLLLRIFIPRSSSAAVLTGAQAKTGYPVGEASVELRLWELPVLLRGFLEMLCFLGTL